MQKLVRSVPVGDYVIDYVARLVRATRPKDPTAPEFVKKMVDWGAGPRAGHVPDPGRQGDGRAWTAASAWPSTTSRRSPCPCCGTASAPTSRPRPRARPARTSSRLLLAARQRAGAGEVRREAEDLNLVSLLFRHVCGCRSPVSIGQLRCPQFEIATGLASRNASATCTVLPAHFVVRAGRATTPVRWLRKLDAGLQGLAEMRSRAC